jgi:dienelactone hydrolase
MEEVLENPTWLASPLNPTASAFEPDAISLVLSRVLRSRPESLAFVPVFNPTADQRAEADAAARQRARQNVIEFFRAKSAGR